MEGNTLVQTATLGIIGLCLVSCSADLVVNKAVPTKFEGIRVYTLANYKVTKHITPTTPSSSCPTQIVETILSLPADAYDITVKTSWFAKSEFTVMLADNGTLKQVTLNSTPQTADNINAAASLVKAIGDAIPKPPLSTFVTECGPTVEKIVKIERFCDERECPRTSTSGVTDTGTGGGSAGRNN